MKKSNIIILAAILIIALATIVGFYAFGNAKEASNEQETDNVSAANGSEKIFVLVNDQFIDTNVSFSAICVTHKNEFETNFDIITESYGKDASVGFRFDPPFQSLNEESFILKEKDKRSFAKKVSGAWEYVKTNVYVNVDGEEKRYEKNITCLIGGDTNNEANTVPSKPVNPTPVVTTTITPTGTATPDPTTTTPKPKPTDPTPIPEFSPITFVVAIILVIGMVAIMNNKRNKK